MTIMIVESEGWIKDHIEESKVPEPRKRKELSHTEHFDRLVQDIKKNLEFDERKMAMAGDLVGDFEDDAKAWFTFLKTEKPVNGMARGENGRVYHISMETTPLPKEGEETLTPESALLGIAITMAKLEKIRELVGDTHLNKQVDRYLDDLEAQKEAILFPHGFVDKEKLIRRSPLMPASTRGGQLRFGYIQLFGTLVLTSLVLSACGTTAGAEDVNTGNTAIAGATSTSEYETQNAPTMTPSPSPTTMPPPTNTEVPTPTEIPLSPEEQEALQYECTTDKSEAKDFVVPMEFAEKGGLNLLARLKYPVEFGDEVIQGDVSHKPLPHGKPGRVLEWSDETEVELAANPEKSPHQTVCYASFWGTKNEKPYLYVASVHAWKNSDGSVVYYTLGFPEAAWDAILNQDEAFWPVYGASCSTTSVNVPGCRIVENEEINEAIKTWEAEDDIPKKLEEEIMFGLGGN